MAEVADVVVVGGGIAGGSLAYALANAGLGVTVLEASTEYEDRVRGESMVPWGVKEARELGVEETLVRKGAHVAGTWMQYFEGIGEAGAIPVGMVVPEVTGSLNLRHPDACQALVDDAATAGATIVRGARDIELRPGPSPELSYTTNGERQDIRAQLVVGADGRASTVRKQGGIELHHAEPMNYIAGLLLDDLEMPDDMDAIGGEGDLMFVLFHQGGGRARAYLIPGLSGQHRFAGREATQNFLDAWDFDCFPYSKSIAAGTPAGPCKTYPGDDTWTASPYAPGVVLIGDAAGHNDPIIGQGLSIAMRDARMVRDLVIDGARSPDAFESYGAERVARMKRLRFIADVMSVANSEDAANRRARRDLFASMLANQDPRFLTLLIGAFAEPMSVTDDQIDDSLLAFIRAA